MLCAAPPQAKQPAPKETKPATQDPQAALIARGKYLVGPAGKCGDCHTPMDDKGQPIESKTLQGARIMFKPAVPLPAWAEFAPPIAGLPGFTDAQAIAFFTTGKDVSGKFAAPPMPRYRFSEKDAPAVVAYLRSLAPQH